MELDLHKRKKWFKQRAKMFSDMAGKVYEGKDLDEVRVELEYMQAGLVWLDFYVNGKWIDTIDLSAAFDPAHDISDWLAHIADGRQLVSTLEIKSEFQYSVLCFEHIRRGENGFCMKDNLLSTFDDKRWENSLKRIEPDENGLCKVTSDQCFDYGLFYVYRSRSDEIRVKAIVKTKELVNRIYSLFLGRADMFNERDWYYSENGKGRWDFYNKIKSPIVEWFLASDGSEQISDIQFRQNEWVDRRLPFSESDIKKKEENDSAPYILIDGQEYDLSNIDGLAEWLERDKSKQENDFETDDEPSKDERQEFLYAMKIRAILPDNIDLVCGDQPER